MFFYFAPLEGLTGHVYRNAHAAFFKGIHKYFSPFITANQSGSFKTRELHDILPENNQGINLVPQLLTNNAADFNFTSKKIRQLGYGEINLNLGCPSGTVVSKYKGSGFLSKRDELDTFFEKIFAQAETKISVKTRIGKDRPEEFYELLEIFNKYPIEELTIHPRIQKDFYKNKPNLKIFEEALLLSKNPVCYNGDIFNAHDYAAFTADFPLIGALMLGRGLITNPGLVDGILNRAPLDKNLLRQFHDRIYTDYKQVLVSERNVLFKMKDIWFYMASIFTDSAKYYKKIKKTEKFYEYEDAVSSLFREQDILSS